MRKGFTLIELLIVIAVISILIGIALPRFRGMQQEGWSAQAKGELRTLQTAVESYRIHNTGSITYPTDLEGATPQIIGSTAPTDPFDTGTDYGFGESPDGNYYVIYSAGPGGAATVTGIDNNGDITGTAGDDLYVSNGSVGTSW